MHEFTFKDINSIQSAMGKEVEVKTIDNIIHSGFLYIIDPGTGTTIIKKGENKEDIKLEIISYHAISSFTTKGDRTADTEIFDETHYKPEDVQKRKVALMHWLKQNLIDITEDGNALKFEDRILIEPPYKLENCYCVNTVVLERVRDIINKCPDFQNSID